MKKLAQVALQFVTILLLATSAYAGTISLNTISPDSNAVAYNDNFTEISDTVNGSIEGSTDSGSTVSNIKADTVFEINMADDANPRLRDSELLSITTDSTTASNTFVYSGGIPADSANLTSNISACTAYVNGYRVVKTATSNTYTASRDTWVDLSQSGVYTFTPVTNGAGEPVVAANSARLAKVVTDGTEITSVTDEANRRIPGLLIPSHYRAGLFVSRDSATTVTVLPGSSEINNTMVNKTATTTLTISTAGDWAGGSSLRAADTFGFVGSDSSGNLKLHTTAPAFDNYALTTSSGKRRYASWSSTTYRILGWFYMDGSGSGNVEVVSNVKEGDVPNIAISQDPTTSGVVTNFTTTSATDVDLMKVRFYSSGNPIKIRFNSHTSNSSNTQNTFNLSQDLATTSLYAQRIVRDYQGTAALGSPVSVEYLYTPPQATRTYRSVVRGDTGTATVAGRILIVEEA